MTIRRLKTYAGSQGYVYQYYFVGQRPGSAGLDAHGEVRELPVQRAPGGVEASGSSRAAVPLPDGVRYMPASRPGSAPV